MLQYTISCNWGCTSHATKRVFSRTFHGGNAIGHAFFLTMYAILIIGYTVMFVILDVKVLDTTKYLSAYVALVFGMGNCGDGKMHPRDS